MTSFYTARVIYSILFFVLASVLLVLAKPRFLFDLETGEPKPFGLGPGRTLFSMGVIVLVLAVLVFYTFGLIDMVYACAEIPRAFNRSAAQPAVHLQQRSPISNDPFLNPSSSSPTESITGFPPATPSSSSPLHMRQYLNQV